MTRKEIIDGLKFTIDMFLFDTSTGETFTEPRNDMDKITIDACRGAIELLKQTDGDLINRDNAIELVNYAIAENKDVLEVLENIPSADVGESRTDGDLISREDARKFLYERLDWLEDDELYDIFSKIIDDLYNELPSAEKTATFKIVGNTTMHYECSICDGDVDRWDKYCKHCGSKMQESEEE